MKSAITTILGAVVVAAFAGCSVQVNVHEKNETNMGTHHVVVKPGSTFTSSSSSSSGDDETYQFSCGEISVTIQNEDLVVNNVKYGALKTGDAVLIDNGKVSVANEERQGTPMSDKEVLSSASVKESVKDLAGFNVTVRPGSSFTSTTQVFGKHTLTIGKTKISIKKNELFVNDKPYGQLKTGDTILVESKVVSVSGAVRDQKK
jgi:hypothetical protein